LVLETVTGLLDDEQRISDAALFYAELLAARIGVIRPS